MSRAISMHSASAAKPQAHPFLAAKQLSMRSAALALPELRNLKSLGDVSKQRMWSEQDHAGDVVVSKEVVTVLPQERVVELSKFPESVLHFPSSVKGTTELRRTFAEMAQCRFLQGGKVDPEHLVISTGAGAILENLFFCLSDPGDAVLIPAPYHPALDTDLKVKCGVVPVAVQLDRTLGMARQLEAARQAAIACGRKVRVMLISQPDNLTGTMYDDEELLQILAWCLTHGVHLVSNETYAPSVYAKGARHISALAVATAEAGRLPRADRMHELLHLVWGFSEDFAASGMQVGALHSRNPALLQAHSRLSYFDSASNHTQWTFQQLLSDSSQLDAYLDLNCSRLRKSADILSEGLKEAGIPFEPSVAGMFTWVDLSSLLHEPSWEAEQELWNSMALEYGLLLTPGGQCHAAEPGFFRMCWGWASVDALPDAITRLKMFVRERQETCTAVLVAA